MVLKALSVMAYLTGDVYMGTEKSPYKTIRVHSGMYLEKCHDAIGKSNSF